MKKFALPAYLFFVIFLVACGSVSTAVTIQTLPTVNATGTAQALSMPLSVPGPYTIGTREHVIHDSTRDGQEISMPLIFPGTGDKPDMSGAPYPVIIYSQGGDANDGYEHRWNNHGTLTLLASYGFFVVAPQHDTVAEMLLTDRPMDILAVVTELKRLAAGEYSGLFDMGNIGMLGISAGTVTTLQTAGARIDYNYFDPWCEKNTYSVFCDAGVVAKGRKDVVGNLPIDTDGLYYIKDAPPLRAVAVMSPCFQPLFGDRGMSTVTVPVLLLAPTKDEYCNYQIETVTLFQDLVSEDRYLINLVNARHDDPLLDTPKQKMVMAAFFGYYLKGEKDYAQYLTEDFINSVDGLSWGVYQP